MKEDPVLADIYFKLFWAHDSYTHNNVSSFRHVSIVFIRDYGGAVFIKCASFAQSKLKHDILHNGTETKRFGEYTMDKNKHQTACDRCRKSIFLMHIIISDSSV